MELFPTRHEKLDEKEVQGSQYCFGLSTELLGQILQKLPTKELLKVSLVNKLWNREARMVMKKRNKLIPNPFRCKYGENHMPNQKLVAFAADLRKMNVVPFCGIWVDVCCPGCSYQSVSNESLERAYNDILDVVPWKNLSVKFSAGRENCKNCPKLVLVKRILEDHCGVLEDLTLAYGTEELYQNIFQRRSLSCLQNLKLTAGNYDGHVTSAFIKTLVSRAPNLQKLYMDGIINLPVNVLEGSSAVLTVNSFKPLLQPICEGLIGSTRASNLDMRIQTNEINPRLLSTIIPKLLEACRTTLKTLWMDLLFAVPLMTYGICLDNVTKLTIAINGDALEAGAEQSVLALAKGLDFTRIFPKLSQVTIINNINTRCFLSDVVGSFVEQGNAVLGKTLSGRAKNIKILELGVFKSIRDSNLSFLAEMFPDIKTVYNKGTLPESSFNLLRQYFPCLKEVIDIEYYSSELFRARMLYPGMYY